MFQEKLNDDFIKSFVNNNYELVFYEMGLMEGQRKIDYCIFLNRLFKVGVNYNTLDNEGRNNVKRNGRKIISAYYQIDKEKKKEDIRKIDMENMIGKYYYIAMTDPEIIKIKKITTQRLYFTYIKMKSWYVNSDLVFAMDGDVPIDFCDGFMLKHKFFDSDILELKEEQLPIFRAIKDW